MQNYYNIKYRNAIYYYTVKYYDNHFETIATKKNCSEIINTLYRSNKIFYLNYIALMGYSTPLKIYFRIADPQIIQF